MLPNSIAIYLKPRLLAVLVLGFVSGLPLALTGSTLTAWLTESGVDLTNIGFYASIGIPYTFKFFISPLVDGLNLPIVDKLLGKRRSWMVFIQILLMLSIFILGLFNPSESPWWVALFAFWVATFSATQDTIIDAYRVEILPKDEQGEGAAVAVLGYRIGMIASGAGALFLATAYGWQTTYHIMAAIIPIAWLVIWFAGEPEVRGQDSGFRIQEVEIRKFSVWFDEYVIKPFTDFMQREEWLVILLFIALYKLGDAFIGNMANPFYLKIGFSKNEIATIVKFYGLIATIAGSFIGSWLIKRIGVMKTLWFCGIGHALTNLMFIAQARVGADTGFLAFSISIENVSGGMGLTAFVAFISNLVNVRFTATQYALLSSLSAVGRTLLSTPSGWVAKNFGWELFFILSVLLAVPGLVVLWWLSKKNWGIGEMKKWGNEELRK